MAVPKRRLSRRKKRVNMKKKMRKIINILQNPVRCKYCGHLKIPHMVCFNCKKY